MELIRNLKIRDQLLTLLLLLLIPLIYFAIVQVKQDVDENAEYEAVKVQLTESEKISDFIHQLQKERARIRVAATGDSTFFQEAIDQRSNTDAAFKDLQVFLESSNLPSSELSLVNELNRYRTQLDQGKLEQQEFRSFSSAIIARFLERVDANATGLTNVQLSRELQSFTHLVEAKILLGRIRTLMMQVVGKEELSMTEYAMFISLKNSYDMAMNRFERYASKEDLQEVHKILASPSFKEISGVFQLLERSPQADLSSYDPLGTFNLFTRSVEALKKSEEQMIAGIKQDVEAESQQRKSNLIIVSILTLLVLGLAAFLSLYIINLVSSSLVSLKSAADRIKLGAMDVEIPVKSRNEIGVVADSFNGVVQKNLALTRVAEAIGEGNYEVEVVPQSPEDRLSFAILEMKDNLSQFSLQNRHRNWILTGISDLNNLITGETKTEEIAEKVISFLCEYSESEAGVFYLHDDAGNLKPSAAYGVPVTIDELPTFAIGTGSLGQAVSKKKIRVMEEVEQEYLKIRSALTEIKPAGIIILPLYFNSTIVGAMELCSRQPISEQKKEFLTIASERVAIILNTLQAHIKTQELLYATQNQAEELETQQEELRELNAELKASEEELKVSQEELQEKNAELEEKAQLLEEQYEALRTKNNALEDAREAIELKIRQVEAVSKYKSEFLANMSHELRTPLNSILILSRLLADNPEKTLNAKQAEHARIIHKSGSDLLKLINEILDLSKIESGMIRLEMEEISVEDIDLESTFKELALNKKIDFTVNYHQEDLETITTDRFRLEQILKNFLSNAIKFTDPGGKVELSIEKVHDKDRFGFSAEQLTNSDKVIAFSVKDTGIGIPKEKQDAIFEAFQQADSSTTRKYGGTGLGLAICKELAGLLGGEIKLESEPGKGSTFRLFLPKEPQQAPQQEKKKTPVEIKKIPVQKTSTPPLEKGESANAMLEKLLAKKDNKEISVLIIEDDKGFNDILADFALAKNFKVHQSFTGNDGLSLAREVKPEAVMLDINLPDISGWEVLKQIREDSELRHVNVHVMSAYDKDVIGKQQGNEEYLPKPVTLEMLNTAFTTISALSHSSIETILIVEDNEVENKAIAELLLAHSLQSLSAYSAEEAERLLARHKVDCIILDLNLPGMKGYDWMGKIRSTKGLSDIPIIIYSGKDLSEEEEIKLKKFANTIIIKNEYSYLRLLDEVQLFLHKVNQKLPVGNDFKMKLHVPEEILQNKKVLLVDDDVRNVYSLSNLLELQGITIVEAYNGKEAIEKLKTVEGIDMVLMDVMMPEMDGIEATKRIRKMEAFKDLPIIALTAKAMKEDRENCIQAGASDYIPKPVDTEKLLTLMRIWLYEA